MSNVVSLPTSPSVPMDSVAMASTKKLTLLFFFTKCEGAKTCSRQGKACNLKQAQQAPIIEFCRLVNRNNLKLGGHRRRLECEYNM